jgi:antitoxin ParD1/3/4
MARIGARLGDKSMRLLVLPISGINMSMGKNTSISLGAHYEEYVRRKVESGEFATVSEVIRDAMRLAEARDLKIEQLRQLIREGEESGPAEPFDFDIFLKEMRANYKGAA